MRGMRGNASPPPELTLSQKQLAVGQCNFLLLFIMSTAAIACGMAATAYCNFMNRNVKLVDGADVESLCSNYTEFVTCEDMFNNHGVGFWGWQITVPIDTLVCYPYTIWINGAYRTPTLDTKFNSARAFSTTASFFGLLAFFTLGFAGCCPIPQSRMKCISIYFLIAFFFQAMTFIFKQSSACQKDFFAPYFPLQGVPDEIESVSCSLSRYSNMAIAATVLYWVCAGMCSRAIPPQPAPTVFNQGQQQPQQEETPAANEEEQA
eukprot:CAMPEP_0178564552 /NCGR_PEP_ID=MMETSP0697-20121206/13687_1 /TAXON_ID=265572 /ORGANISM="Extubocellulus spinifer, Strain CCMP396" /LENGTH=262 /DNA_ID=CAMNT_0020198095 /DNA_START=144 /DNA_END=932 /DNA_ORIENTATION=-